MAWGEILIECQMALNLLHCCRTFRPLSTKLFNFNRSTLTKGGSLVETWAECQHDVVDGVNDSSKKERVHQSRSLLTVPIALLA